jgi:anti-sigma28 factor (negative regulator of flagellin synthesis)
MDIGRVPRRRPTQQPTMSDQVDAAGSRKESTGALRIDESLRELSEVADAARRDLVTANRESSSEGDVSPLISRRARVEESKRRIAQGYYSRPDVRQKIVDRLADNLNP